MSEQNLDRLCAEYGYKMAAEVYNAMRKSGRKNAENHITKSLGILQENGVYAFLLYQESRSKSERPGAEKLKCYAAQLLKNVPLNPFNTVDDPLEAVRGNEQTMVPGLANNLDDLLLAKRLLEQALIYARYHAKAMEG